MEAKGDTQLLAIVANERGAEEAIQYGAIDFLGYPFSISETFQLRNTNATIEDFQTVRNAIHEAEILDVVGSSEIMKEKVERDKQVAKIKVIQKGMNKLTSISDFEVKDGSVYFAGINRTLPQLLVEKFLEIVEKNEYYSVDWDYSNEKTILIREKEGLIDD